MLNRIRPALVIVGLVLLLIALPGCKVGDSGTNNSPLTDQQQQLVDELNRQMIRLTGAPPDLADSSLGFLDRFGSARITGLGEATHGTREFFQMKHRIFRYLVENHGYKAIAFEADFAESIYIDDYITGGPGDLDTLINTVMQYWTWKTEEVKELLEWMRDYNSGKPQNEKIRYFGLDCQHTTYQPSLLQAYFARTVPSLWNTFAPVCARITAVNDYQFLSRVEYDSLLINLQSLAGLYNANQARLTAASSDSEFRLYRQVLRSLVQSFLTLSYKGARFGTYDRDPFMAENAMWLADYLGAGNGVALWAHNNHVAVDADYLASGAMGNFIYNFLSDGYRSLGFAFSKGGFSALGEDSSGQPTSPGNHEITADPRNGSFNFLLHYASANNFVFEPDVFGDGSQWQNWMNGHRDFLMVGAGYNGDPEAYYYSVDIPVEYDLIIYFDTTNPTRLL